MLRPLLPTLLAAATLAMPTSASAELVRTTVDYKQGDTALEGYLVLDTASAARRAGVVVVPDWLGVGKESKRRADDLARLGYVAFVADIYGKGVRPKDGAEAGPLAGKYKADRPLLRARVRAALDELLKQPAVDAGRVAAIGYCFGGTTVLELARSGAAVAGVVTFHGGLDSPSPADGKNIKAKVLILHGADDPFVPPAQVAAVEDELRSGGVDWQLVKYSGAVHSFSNPDAGSDNSKGAAYNAAADRRSWQAMKDFFAEVLR